MHSTLSRVCRCALAAALMGLPGCVSNDRPRHDGQSLLKKPRLAPDSVVLEVFSVHFRRDDQELYRSIWQEVDEQAIAADVRRRLGENGFRAGVVTGHLPQAVQHILELSSQPTPEPDADAPQMNVVTFDGRPTVRIQQMRLPARRRGEIAASGTYPSGAPLVYDDGQLHGESYDLCQGMMAVKALPDNDGRVRLEVVPELHHGEAQRRFTTAEGVLNLETGRPRKVFAKLTQEVTLASGDLYVLGSSQAKPGSLGDYFFTAEPGNAAHAKLVFVRLAHSQNDGLFSPAAPAPAPAEPDAAAQSAEAAPKQPAAGERPW
jgi:hypothetical protein